MAARSERPEVLHVRDETPCTVHLRRPDGLDVEVSGSAVFIQTLLIGLGVVQAPPPPA